MTQAPRPSAADWQTIAEIVAAARDTLAPQIWDYISGGADSETTLRRNAQGLDRRALKPRALRDTRQVDLSTTLLGQRLALPFFPTAIGSLELICPDGVLETARAATALGTTACVSVMSSHRIGRIAADATAPLILQVYMVGDDDWFADTAAQARDAGCLAVAITVDTTRFGRRERDLANRFSPRWAVDRPGLAGTDAALRDRSRAGFDWAALDRVRARCDLPIILKGIGCPEDAVQAADAGVACIYVSNHGGRQLDHGPAAIDQLDAIAQAVGDRVELVMDGGIMRGSDVVKALSLGARAVGLGRLQAHALAAGGGEGLRRALSILAEETEITMALAGATSIAALTRDCFWPGLMPPLPLG